MKASELISALQDLKEKHGDLEVRVLDTDHEHFDPVFSVEHQETMTLWPNPEAQDYFVVNNE